MQAIIQTEGLTKRYGDRVAVDRLTMRVEPGEVFGFLGPNGAGKTTTIGMLLGLVRPTAGHALVMGHDPQREPALALASVGAMIEAPAFYPYLSGRDNLRVLARASRIAPARVEQVLDAVELADRAADRFKAYSQGMRQRLALAAALLPDPQLVMLDEPTNGLDPAGQHEIRALIRGLAADGRTILLCGHQLHEIEQLCGRVAILKQGRLVAEGRVADLLRRGGVLVRVRSDPDQAAALLRGMTGVASVVVAGDELQVDAPDERIPEMTAALAGGGVAVAEIRAQQRTLEDIFLEVTQGESAPLHTR